MNWKKKIAKEWIWFICTVIGVSFALSVLSLFAEGLKGIVGLWEEILWNSFWPPIIVPILIIYIIRLTIWAIKELRRPAKGSKGDEKKNRKKQTVTFY